MTSLRTADAELLMAPVDGSRAKPRVRDSQITYPDVYPGVDLRYTMTSLGLKEEIVLHRDPGVDRFHFVLGGTVRARLTDDGGLTYLGPDREEVFTSPPPFMVETPPNEATIPASSDAVSYAVEGEPGDQTLTVRFDRNWVADPTRRWPVVIDPTTVTRTTTLDTHVEEQNPSQSFNTNTVLRTGEHADGTMRALLKFGMAGLADKTILQANLKLYESYNTSCAPRFAHIYRLTSAFSSTTTWSTRPSMAASSETSSSEAHGNATLGCPDDWSEFLITNLVQNWVTGTWTNHGLAVIDSEGLPGNWRSLRSSEYAGTSTDPVIEVTYNQAPSVVQTTPVDAEWLNTKKLQWDYTDANDDPQARYQVQISSNSGFTSIVHDSGSVISATESHTFTTSLTEGGTYWWRVKVFDGWAWTNWTAGEQFRYSSAAAVPPVPKAPSDKDVVTTPTPALQVEQQGTGITYRFTIEDEFGVVATSAFGASSWTVPAGLLEDGGDYTWSAEAKEPGGLITAPGPQRSVRIDADRLGARDYYAMHSLDLGAGVQGAVNLATGNLVVNQTDASLPTVADPFVVSRTYNSRAAGKPVLVDDDVPYGESRTVVPSSWTWDTSRKWSGARSHKEATASGQHGHSFTGSSSTLYVPHGATIVTYAYLDPASMPREIMLGFHEQGSAAAWDAYAYWGENLINVTPRYSMGARPAGGSWVRLEVPAATLGLEGSVIDGMNFMLYDGQAWFDKTYLGSGPFGYGWTTGMGLVFSGAQFSRLIDRSDHFEAIDGSGASIFYYPVADTPDTSDYVTNLGDSATITSITGSLFELKTLDGTRYRFDQTGGALKSIWSADLGDAASFTYTYLPSGLLEKVTDRLGRELTLSYSNGRLASVTAAFDSGRKLVDYGYDPDGTLTSVTRYVDPNDPSKTEVTRYTYDAVTHDLVTVTTPRGTATGTAGDFQTTFGYQAALAGEDYKRLASISRPHTDGSTVNYVTAFTYDVAARKATLTSPRGTATSLNSNDFVTTYTYNDQGNPIEITDAGGRAVRSEWNDKNLRTSVTDAKGFTTTYDYDGNGNLCRETLDPAIKNSKGDPAVTQYFYDEFAGAYSCAATTMPAHNLQTSVIDPEGFRHAKTYLDPVNGRPWVTAETGGVGTSEAATTCMTYFTNAAEPWRYGKLATKTMPKGATGPSTDPCSSTNANYTASYTYWAPGDTYSFPGDSTLANVSQAGWLKSTSKPGDTPVTCAGAAATACTHYDRRGNEIHTLDAKGDHYAVYDLYNREIKHEDLGTTGNPNPTLWVTSLYDADGNRTQVRDPGVAGDLTGWSFDDLNRMIASTDAHGTTTTYAYDADNNVVSRTTPGVGTVTNVYDGLNRVSEMTDPYSPAGKKTRYFYDENGRLVLKRLPSDTHVDYEYNAAGWLTAQRNRSGADHASTETALIADFEYAYDGNGQRIQEVKPGYIPATEWEGDLVSTDPVEAPATKDHEFSVTAAGPVTVDVGWEATTRDFEFFGQTIDAAGVQPTVKDYTIVAGAPGMINAVLAPCCPVPQLDLQLFKGTPSGTPLQCACSLVLGATETIAYNVTAANVGTYTLRVVNNTPASSGFNLTGDTQVYADVSVSMLDPFGQSVGTLTSPSANERRISHNVTAPKTGDYTVRVTANSDRAEYGINRSYPKQNNWSYSYDALGRLTDVVNGTTARHYDFDKNSNRTALKLNGATQTSYTYNALDQLLSSAGGGTTTYSYNAAGEMTSQLMPGHLLRTDTKTGSVNASGSASQSWSVSATTGGPLRGDLTWEKTTRTFSHLSQPIAAAGLDPGVSTKTVQANAPGPINASLTWTGVQNLDLVLVDPWGVEVDSSSALTGNAESINYTVASGATGNYTLRVENHTPLAATYDVTGDSQVFASMKVEVLDPSNAVVATATGTTGTKSVSYTVPSGSTGTYTYRVTALSDQASYSLAQSFPVENKRSYTYNEGGLPLSEDTNLQKVTWKLDGLGRVMRATREDWIGTVSSDTKYGFAGTSDSRITETPVGSSTPSVGYIADAGELLVTKSGTAVSYGYYSAHGDLVQSANTTGAPTYASPLVYDEFGNPSATGPTPWGWTGQQQRDTNSLTGVIRMGARLYSPRLGRFLSRDPIEGGSANDYDYAKQNPCNDLDLTGTFSVCGGALGWLGGWFGFWGKGPDWRATGSIGIAGSIAKFLLRAERQLKTTVRTALFFVSLGSTTFVATGYNLACKWWERLKKYIQLAPGKHENGSWYNPSRDRHWIA